jgi:hypothetical protein
MIHSNFIYTTYTQRDAQYTHVHTHTHVTYVCECVCLSRVNLSLSLSFSFSLSLSLSLSLYFNLSLSLYPLSLSRAPTHRQVRPRTAAAPSRQRVQRSSCSSNQLLLGFWLRAVPIFTPMSRTRTRETRQSLKPKA